MSLLEGTLVCHCGVMLIEENLQEHIAGCYVVESYRAMGVTNEQYVKGIRDSAAKMDNRIRKLNVDHGRPTA